MGRFGTRRFGARMRRFMPVMVLVAVLALLAGGLPMLVGGSGSGSAPGLAIQAPGSNGSVQSALPWWDPKRWFGGGGGGGSTVPSTHAIAAWKPAVGRPPGRVAGQGPRRPAHRVRELAAKRDAYTRVYQMSDGTQQAVISAGPVNYRTPSGAWAPVSAVVRPSAAPGYAFQNVTNVFRTYFGSTAARLIRFDAPGGGWLAVGLRGARVGTPRISGDTVTYPDVAPGVSLS